MSDKPPERPDQLADKLRRIRLGDSGAGGMVPPNAPLSTLDEVKRELVALKAAVEAARGQPLEVARLLDEAIAKGRAPTEIAKALGVGRPWVAKRLSLLSAPRHVQALVESGNLSETAYYNHRAEVLAALDGETKNEERKVHRRRSLHYVRQPKVYLNESAARASVRLLAHLAMTLGLAPIDVDGTTARELGAILELRSRELWDVLKGKL